MAMLTPAASTPERPVSYKALGVFWLIIGVLTVGGAITLQVLGPAGPRGATYTAAPSTIDKQAAPAPPPKPAPTIADPVPALLEPVPPDVADKDIAGLSLPQAAADGRTPATVYAAAYDKSDPHPRLAFVIDGVGLDQNTALQTLNQMPGPVTVAFSPYAPKDGIDHYAALARAKNHECLLSIPMMPSGYPQVEEGAHELLSTGPDDTEENRKNLMFALSRTGACVGATGASDGLQGESFAQTDQSFADLLTEINRRGLLYLDPRTGAPALLSNATPNIRVVDVIVDQAPNVETPVTGSLIDQRLETLEHLALLRGNAIGLAGPPTPVLLDHISIWANQLAAHGVTLVPLTAIPSTTGATGPTSTP